MVANNTGRAEAGIVAGNFMGVLHSVVTNHKFNQIFLRRMNNTIQRIFARNFESHLRHQGICRRKCEPFKTIHASKIRGNVVEDSFRSRIRRKATNSLGTLVVFPLNSHWLFKEFSFVRIYHCDYFGLVLRPSIKKFSMMMNCYCKITKGVGNFLTAQFTYSTDWPINMIIQTKYIPASVSRRHLKIKKKGEENEPEGKHLNSQAKQEMDQCQYLSTYNPTCSPRPTTVN